MRILGVIPARFGSTRLEGKPLADILGKPMIWHVYACARKARSLDQVLVATDDERIQKVVEGFGGTAVMTDPAHTSGTERVAEAVRDLEADLVVNIQGDEPLLDSSIIDECLRPLKKDSEAQMSTVVRKIQESSYQDAAVVKVVIDLSGKALYFSRSLVPYPRKRPEDFCVYEHLGIYAYRKSCLLCLAKLPPTMLEQAECLEQLRALEHGIPIHVVETQWTQEIVSVDTPSDLEKVRLIMAKRQEVGVRS